MAEFKWLDLVKHIQTDVCNSSCPTYSAGTEGPPSAGLSHFKCWEIAYPQNQTSSVQTKPIVDVWMMRKGKAVFSSTFCFDNFENVPGCCDSNMRHSVRLHFGSVNIASGVWQRVLGDVVLGVQGEEQSVRLQQVFMRTPAAPYLSGSWWWVER